MMQLKHRKKKLYFERRPNTVYNKTQRKIDIKYQ